MLDTQNAVQVPTVRCCSANKGMKYWYNSSMDELESYIRGKVTHGRPHTAGLHSSAMPRTGNFADTERRSAIARGGGGGGGGGGGDGK